MLRNALFVASSVALLALSFACSGGTSSVNATDPDAACSDAASALCNAIDTCAPVLLSLTYADTATCITRTQISCKNGLSAPGTGATTTQLSQCASDVKAAACGDILSRNEPASCQTATGTLADGVACADDPQCVGKLCRKTAGTACGVCSTLAAAGSACTADGDCVTPLACANKLCVPFGKAGAACSANAPCSRDLGCVSGTCATPLEAGAACDPGGGTSCNALKGLICNPKTKVCQAIVFAAAGAACGLTPDGNYTLCSGADKCSIASGTTGTCLAAAADGQPCDDEKGPTCTAPASCVSGVCKLPDATACK